MPADPRPPTARRPDGLEATALELRFATLFRTLDRLSRGLPEDLAEPFAALESEVQALRDDLTARLTALDTSQAAQDARLTDIENRLSAGGL